MRTPLLIESHELRAEGYDSRRIRLCLERGTLIRVRPGMYSRRSDWNEASPETRVVARARALAAKSVRPPVFGFETAAAILGLPLFRPDPVRLHVILSPDRPGAAMGTIRHRGEPADDEIIEHDGLRATTIERTIADMARRASFEQAVVTADAALRALCVTDPGTYDADRADEFRASVLRRARLRAHGVGRAERVLAFADGRAHLPGESISRILLTKLGFRRIRLQVPVSAPGGRLYFVDFGLEDEHAFGEFDGAVKYEEGRLLDGRTSADVFDREKRREDWIRGHSQRRLVRWGWSDLSSAAALGARLEAFGITPSR